jgi:putative ABC transport system permease protein
MNNLKLAARGVTRNKRRTLLAVGSIAIALMVMVVLDVIMDGANENVADKIIETSGHVQLYAPGYYDERRTLPTDIAIGDLDHTLAEIRGMDGVVDATAQVNFGGLAIHDDKQMSGLFTGIELEQADRIHGYSDKITQGRYLTEDDKDGCLLGYRFAEILGLGVGDVLSYVSQTSYGALTAADLTVVGIVQTQNPQIDEAGVLLRLEDAQRQMELDDAATIIIVLGDDKNKSVELKESLLAHLNAGVELKAEPPRPVTPETEADVPLFAGGAPTGGFEEPEEVVKAPTKEGFEGYTWYELNRLIFDVIKQKAGMMDTIRAVLFILAIAMIINTMLTNVFERTQEIGVMMAMGAKGRQVLLVFLGEATTLGILGSLAGVILGTGVGFYLQYVGIDYGNLSGVMNFPMGQILYGYIKPFKIVALFLEGVFISAIAGLYPAAKAARMQPTKALRFN